MLLNVLSNVNSQYTGNYVIIILLLCTYLKSKGFSQFYILSVYSPFSDRVGLPLHNTPFPGVLMKSIGAAFF